MNKDLRALLDKRSYDLDEWLIGKIPKHYKRLTVSKDKAIELAKLGATKIGAYFGEKVFFTQGLIAGAIFSGEYDKVIIVTPSQYGKSWLLARIGLVRAFEGRQIYIAGVSGNASDIIMKNVVQAVRKSTPEMSNALINKQDQLDRLATSVSKTRVAFSEGGFVEAITLADTYNDNLSRNQAVGRAGDIYLDEASLVSEDAYAELGRREFAQLGGERYQMVMISNPHQTGTFYDELTAEEIDDRTIVVWTDCLSAIEEERFTEEQVANSDFAKHRSTRVRYLLCNLDTEGDSMFDTPKTYKGEINGDYVQRFLGVDSAYKGKDNICYCLNAVDENGICYIEEILTVDKGEWVDGVTSNLIIDDIVKIVRAQRVACVCVDIGWGVWLVEGLKQRGVNVKGVNFGSGVNKARRKANHYSCVYGADKRAEMHLDLQNLIETDHLYFEEKAWEKVKDIFPFVKAEIKEGGKYRIIKKSEIKAQIGRSPDELDSVLLSVQAPYLMAEV